MRFSPRGSRSTLTVYMVLRSLVIITMVLEMRRQRWDHVFTCLLTLLLFLLPSIIERRLKIDLPNALEIIILVFIFAAEILGEIAEFYVRFKYWDTILHTTNGFLMAAIGFAMIDILNQSPKFHISLSPAFVAFVSFCFSMTIGVLWEFFEYAMDLFFLMDMQKDTYLQTISSVSLHPDGSNIPVIIRNITETIIVSGHGRNAVETVIHGGYLDLGIHDTMIDMLVNLVGAVVFSVAGVFYLKGRGTRSQKVAQSLIPRLMTIDELEREDSVREELRLQYANRRRLFRRKKTVKTDDSNRDNDGNSSDD